MTELIRVEPVEPRGPCVRRGGCVSVLRIHFEMSRKPGQVLVGNRSSFGTRDRQLFDDGGGEVRADPLANQKVRDVAVQQCAEDALVLDRPRVLQTEDRMRGDAP